MNLIRNETTGKYVVELAGVVWNNCTTDADCPGRAMCGKNITWAEYPNMCACLFIVGHDGPTCHEISPLGYFFFVLNVLICVVSGVWALVGIFDLVRMIRWGRLKKDAVSSSLLFAICALCSISIYGGATSRYPFERMTPNPVTGSKNNQNYTGTVALTLAFLFATLAMLNISLVWIKIASNADKLQKANNHNIAHYRHFLIAYYVIFFGAIIISVALGNYVVTAFLAIPGIIFVIISYGVGYFRMRKMLSVYISSDAIPSNSRAGGLNQAKDSVQKFRDSLQLIKNTTIGAASFALAFIICIGIWAFAGGFNPLPSIASVSVVSLCLAWLSASVGVGFIMWYLHETIKRKGKAIGAAAALNALGATANPRFEQSYGTDTPASPALTSKTKEMMTLSNSNEVNA